MESRSEILRHLLFHKEGLTIDELSSLLGISRSGVQQHLSNLQKDRLVREDSRRNPGTGGRPSRVFTLTEDGREHFPRQYALFSVMLLKGLKESVGKQQLLSVLEGVAQALYKENAHRVDDEPTDIRIEKTAELMNELGYEASVLPDGSGISAVNCVYHQLASEMREVCHLDIELLSRLTNQSIDHTQCMVDGDHACVFKMKPQG